MTENDSLSVMQRKTGAGRASPEVSQVTIISVLRQAVAQAAEDALGLNASVTSIKESQARPADLGEKFPENALYTLCQRSEDEIGVIVLDQESRAALIEVQTIGRVSSATASQRPATRTDALLCSGFLNTILLLFEQGTADADLPIAASIMGYRYAAPLVDVRAIEMALADGPYQLFELEIDFQDGKKVGRMFLLLPLTKPVKKGGEGNGVWQVNLEKAVSCTHVEMEAVLARKEIQLEEITEFEVGSIITLPGTSVREISLIGVNGSCIAIGRLGQSAGMRAICISQTDKKPKEKECLPAKKAKPLLTQELVDAVNPNESHFSDTPTIASVSERPVAEMPLPAPEEAEIVQSEQGNA